jgi:hypothetical protein
VPSMCNVTLTAQKLQKPDLYSATECWNMVVAW